LSAEQKLKARKRVKPYVIVNPVAGSIVDLNVVLRQLRRLNAKEVRVTQRPGEAETLAREAVRAGSGYIIAAGGDGTLVLMGAKLMSLPVNPVTLSLKTTV